MSFDWRVFLKISWYRRVPFILRLENIFLSQVNEDTKANVSELQQKLLKVTADNEDRIKELQEKLQKVM